MLSSLTIDDLIKRAKLYLPGLREERIRHAYRFAEAAHNGQVRFSGEPYIIHPLNVANILLDFHPDEDSIITALLHDVVEDTDHTLDDIEKEFSVEIRNLCSGLVKLSKVRSRLNDTQIENLRKLFLAMAKDFRVVLLKLCDRLHNMRTLHFVRPEKQTRIAQETLNIYAPIASRLGIYRLKSQLEDLCFRHLHPQECEDIQSQLVKSAKWREHYIETAKQILAETLSREGIHAEVDGRVKSAYSIYRKLKKKNKNLLSDVFDVFAMRIVLPDIYKYGKEYIGHLYTALGVIHNNFTPLANRFKDYVAVPKVNGYRSLHTTVMGLGPKVHTQPTEIQIRTNSMHEFAELGVAAHWMYEEGMTEVSYAGSLAEATLSAVKQQKQWISGLEKIETEIKNNQELLENLKADIFQDRIFVLTPRGDVRDLPSDATPVDFAYSVHTDIGNHCVGAKVNGNIVNLDYTLKSGEVVEIMTRKNARPSQHWLSFARTNHAKNRIRSWFRGLDEDKHLREGRDLLNQKITQFGLPLLDDHLSILRNYGSKHLSLRQREDLLIEIGKGAILSSHVLRRIFTPEQLLEESLHGEVRTPSSDFGKQSEMLSDHPKVSIGGQENMPYHFVKCCGADWSDELVGYVTRGRGVSLHRRKCSVLKNTESHRLVPVKVLSPHRPIRHYPVTIQIDVNDRLGLIRDISAVIAESHINIVSIDQQTTSLGNTTELSIKLDIEHLDQLERVLSKIENIESVRRAFKLNVGSRV